MRDIELAYGKTGLRLALPDHAKATVIRKRALAVPVDAARVVEQALANPVEAQPLESLARGASSACVLICDITRPVPNHLFLRPLIERLLGSGVAAGGITVLVATGLHRPNVGDELCELVGDPWVMDNVTVANHDSRDDAAHVSLGETRSRKVPVSLDRRFVEAEVKIATGLVEPHFMAGYSGGRKVIAPGVAHHTTIRTFHSARFMEDPKASSCNLSGNPLHEEQLEIIGMLGRGVLAFNTVIDEDRSLVYASFGDVVASHMAAVEFVRDSIEVKVPRRFSTVVTSAAGYPLDKTYYQTVKGMVTPLDILQPGGTLIIASDCSEGVGSAEFRAAQQRLIELGPDAFLQTLIDKQLADVDEWQTEMQLKPMRVGNIALYSQGMSDADHALTGVERVHNLTSAIHDSIEQHDDPAVAVVPEGPYVVPFFSA